MKTLKNHRLTFFGIFGSGLIVVAVALTALSQTAPVLTITPLGTNQFSISFTNNGSTYDLQGTPVLANPAYPWTWAATASPARAILLSPAFIIPDSTGRFWIRTASPFGKRLTQTTRHLVR